MKIQKYMNHRKRKRGEETQTKFTENISDKIIEEKFPNPKKEMVINVQAY